MRAGRSIAVAGALAVALLGTAGAGLAQSLNAPAQRPQDPPGQVQSPQSGPSPNAPGSRQDAPAPRPSPPQQPAPSLNAPQPPRVQPAPPGQPPQAGPAPAPRDWGREHRPWSGGRPYVGRPWGWYDPYPPHYPPYYPPYYSPYYPPPEPWWGSRPEPVWVPGQWVWNGWEWVWRPGYWAYY